MIPRFEDYLRSKAISFAFENWKAYECAQTFGVDYKNMCAYLKGRILMPMHLVFEILDYLNCSVVVFKSK